MIPRWFVVASMPGICVTRPARAHEIVEWKAVIMANAADLLIGVINAHAQNQGNGVCRDSLEVVRVETGKHLE
jgi:hypothetical protein